MPISAEVQAVAGRFGPRLREMRKEAGQSQKALAEAAGVSQALVAAYELSQYAPSWDIVLALAHALGVSVGAFTVAAKNQDSG